MFLSLRHVECILGVPKTCRVGLRQFMATGRGGCPCVLFCWCCCNKGPSLDVGITYLYRGHFVLPCAAGNICEQRDCSGETRSQRESAPHSCFPVRPCFPRVPSHLTWLLVRKQTSLMQGLSLGSGFHPRHPAVSTFPVLGLQACTTTPGLGQEQPQALILKAEPSELCSQVHSMSKVPTGCRVLWGFVSHTGGLWCSKIGFSSFLQVF